MAGNAFSETKAVGKMSVDDEAYQELDNNYFVDLQVTQNEKPSINMNFVAGIDKFEISALDHNSDVVTFRGKIHPRDENSVLLVYLLGVREHIETIAKESKTKEDSTIERQWTFIDTGINGAAIIELGKPINLFSAGNRSYQIKVEKQKLVSL